MSYEDAVRELFFYTRGTAGGFYSMLFDLFAKADSDNQARLAQGFYNEHQAFKKWQASGDYGNDLFREHGLMK
jgi:hypothetical protein